MGTHKRDGRNDVATPEANREADHAVPTKDSTTADGCSGIGCKEPSPLLAAALEYHEAGWSVIPMHHITTGGRCSCGKQDCSAPGKHPRVSWKEFSERRASVEDIESWWKRWTRANVGGVTGHISGRVVLDIDGEEGWAELSSAGIELPKTPQVQTGRGAHFHMATPHGTKVKSKAGVLTKVDVRGEGGVVVLPPSSHASGSRYEWEVSPTECAEADVPKPLLELLTKQQAPSSACTGKPSEGAAKYGEYFDAALRGEVEKVRAAAEGIRHDTLISAAFSLGTLVPHGMDEASARGALTEAGLASGLPEAEVRRAVADGIEAGSACPRDMSDVEGAKKDKSTIAQQLVRLAEGVELFHDELDRSYARIEQDGTSRCLSTRSRNFARWLKLIYYRHTGRVPNANSLRDAIGLLEARAVFDGPLRELSRRVARHEGAIYVDLGTESGDVVEVTPQGWSLASEAPMTFVRSDSMLPLPEPTRGGSVEPLRELLNLPDDEQWVLFVGWLLGALRPEGPYPILVVQGEHGSAKSTLCRIARALVDPDVAQVCRPPKGDRDLMISASHSHLLIYDNLSGLSEELADGLCGLATGVGLRTRGLYTDDEEMVFSASRPIILNGIEALTDREDLASRAIVLRLPPITDTARRTEKDVDGLFQSLRPRVFGALLDAVAHAMANEHSTPPAELPRMADFAKWVAGAEDALGWESGTFADALNDNYRVSVLESIDNDIVATMIVRMVSDTGRFEGTASDLLAEISSRAPRELREAKDFPRTHVAIGRRLERMTPLLRRIGVTVSRTRVARGRRLIVVEQVDEGGEGQPTAEVVENIEMFPMVAKSGAA